MIEDFVVVSVSRFAAMEQVIAQARAVPPPTDGMQKALTDLAKAEQPGAISPKK